ncbi:antibiotic biosynthesis monooxygenase [Lactobacillus hamsteri]|uniref:ABM domain-containing protein n=1 Tax=Lactobacillus hamsteri DSM 5661 = JCM 6256 TaxID=1423754 RepID=A0A0R1YDS4_9LACO|nr:antibiotic biosynthesis monooxygenase [Lactobacillus hamsteri]KRM40712.1 hypothetical protein FC39_GL000196 [Lactobacillus hamsteri DSM 5661 = JCM 6256]
MKLSNAPIFRIYQLDVNDENRNAFLEGGKDNILTSIKNEPGTLAMFLAHNSEENDKNYMVEVYRDNNAYQTHVNSPQFNRYRENAPRIVQSTLMWDLQTEFIATKSDKLDVVGDNDFSIHLAKVSIEKGKKQEFADVVENEMRISVTEEPGVIAMFAGTDKNSTDDWYFYEIYKNDDAYNTHIRSQQFKDYISGSQDWLTDKKLQVLNGDILTSQDQLEFNN